MRSSGGLTPQNQTDLRMGPQAAPPHHSRLGPARLAPGGKRSSVPAAAGPRGPSPSSQHLDLLWGAINLGQFLSSLDLFI